MIVSARATFSRWFRDLAGPLLSVAFPAGCRLCDRGLLNASRLPVCDLSLSSFKRLTTELCPLCGQALALGEMLGEESDLCRGCQERRYAFNVARSFGVYRDVLVRAILLLKYELVEPLGAWFAKRLAEFINSEPGLLNADIAVPVPLHRFRQKERGFKQVDLFGRPLARLFKLPYRPVLLVRERPRPEQHLLRNDQRWEAVRGAFAIQKGL
jgi:predicted amidophosphoribosyltransferase